MIEMLVALPVFVSLWLLGIYAMGFHAARSRNAEHVRECTWHYAVGGCETMPATCSASTASPVDDGPLRLAIRNELRELSRRVPLVAPALTSLHGDSFAHSRQRQIERPKMFGGSTRTTASYRTMCNERGGQNLPPAPVLPQLFRDVCTRYGAWCTPGSSGRGGAPAPAPGAGS